MLEKNLFLIKMALISTVVGIGGAILHPTPSAAMDEQERTGSKLPWNRYEIGPFYSGDKEPYPYRQRPEVGVNDDYDFGRTSFRYRPVVPRNAETLDAYSKAWSATMDFITHHPTYQKFVQDMKAKLPRYRTLVSSSRFWPKPENETWTIIIPIPHPVFCLEGNQTHVAFNTIFDDAGVLEDAMLKVFEPTYFAALKEAEGKTTSSEVSLKNTTDQQ